VQPGSSLHDGRKDLYFPAGTAGFRPRERDEDIPSLLIEEFAQADGNKKRSVLPASGATDVAQAPEKEERMPESSSGSRRSINLSYIMKQFSAQAPVQQKKRKNPLECLSR
jgi:hypothetical protein